MLAANAILLNLQSIMAYGLDGFAYAAEVLVGSAVGARNLSMLRDAVRISTVWAAALSVVIAALYFLFGPAIVALFTTIEGVRREAGRYLIWIALSPLLSIWSFQLDGIFIGATRTAEMRNGMILALIVYLIGATALVPLLGQSRAVAGLPGLDGLPHAAVGSLVSSNRQIGYPVTFPRSWNRAMTFRRRRHPYGRSTARRNRP